MSRPRPAATYALGLLMALPAALCAVQAWQGLDWFIALPLTILCLPSTLIGSMLMLGGIQVEKVTPRGGLPFYRGEDPR